MYPVSHQQKGDNINFAKTKVKKFYYPKKFKTRLLSNPYVDCRNIVDLGNILALRANTKYAMIDLGNILALKANTKYAIIANNFSHS